MFLLGLFTGGLIGTITVALFASKQYEKGFEDAFYSKNNLFGVEVEALGKTGTNSPCSSYLIIERNEDK